MHAHRGVKVVSCLSAHAIEETHGWHDRGVSYRESLNSYTALRLGLRGNSGLNAKKTIFDPGGAATGA